MRLPMIGFAALALGACYAPEVRDCTVTCSASTDCADDQVCGSDKYCAAPEVSGTCDSTGGSGSGSATVALRLTVHGRGVVTVQGVGQCGSLSTDQDDCTWQLTMGTPVAMNATDTNFDRWSSSVCNGKSLTCNFTPTTSTIVTARFKSGGGDDGGDD